MIISKKKNLKIIMLNNENELFGLLDSKFNKNDVTIPFIRIKSIKRLKNNIFVVIKVILKLEEIYNREITLFMKNEKERKLAKDQYRLLVPKKIKIGIALGGGGARGALQVGQLQVLNEYNLLNNYDVMSSTSIGAFNMINLVCNGLDSNYDMWHKKQEHIIFKKRNIKDMIINGGIFSRDDTRAFIDSILNEKCFDKDYPSYYINSFSWRKKELKSLHINHRSKERIKELTLASSAIPFIYGLTKYDNDIYIDAGVMDNQSIKCLIDKGCNVIFALSLSIYPKCSTYTKNGLCIIDMGSVNFYKFLLSGSFSFDKDVDKKIKHGYDVSKKLFQRLENEKVLDIIINRKVNEFYKLENYYHLSKKENNFKIDKHIL